MLPINFVEFNLNGFEIIVNEQPNSTPFPWAVFEFKMRFDTAVSNHNGNAYYNRNSDRKKEDEKENKSNKNKTKYFFKYTIFKK